MLAVHPAVLLDGLPGAGSCGGGFLFADDATLSFPGVKVAWQELVDQGHLETLYCTVEGLSSPGLFQPFSQNVRGAPM